MADAVFILCALTSLACAVLLTRSWLQNRRPILLGSALCFVGLMLNSALLVVDKIITGPAMDLSLVNKIPALVGLLIFAVVLIWEDE